MKYIQEAWKLCPIVADAETIETFGTDGSDLFTISSVPDRVTSGQASPVKNVPAPVYFWGSCILISQPLTSLFLLYNVMDFVQLLLMWPDFELFCLKGANVKHLGNVKDAINILVLVTDTWCEISSFITNSGLAWEATLGYSVKSHNQFRWSRLLESIGLFSFACNEMITESKKIRIEINKILTT